MTDERQGESLWHALMRLPRGAGIIFRHYHSPAGERRRLYDAVRAVARRRRLVLVLAGSPALALAWQADGMHGRTARRLRRPGLRTAPAHDRRELLEARRNGADLIFLSPVFATRSHPGAASLGIVRFGLIARGGGSIVALGGMNPVRAKRLRRLGSHGWAAIDALSA